MSELVFEGLRTAEDVMGVLDAEEGSYAYCLIRCMVVELARGTVTGAGSAAGGRASLRAAMFNGF